MPSSIHFLLAATLSTNIIGLWDAYLLFRQRRAFNTKDIPAYFKETMTKEEFDAAQAYSRDSASYSLLVHLKDLVLGNAHLLLRIPARLYYCAARFTGLPVGSFAHNYASLVATDVIATALEVPFSYYDSFYLEERHGFNKMTKMEFAKDIVKSFLLRITLYYPIHIALIQFVVRRFGERFPIYLFGGMTALVFAFTLIYPTFIQPLFNTFTPLDKETPLNKKIESLCAAVHFPLKKIYVMDGSCRSHHSNAYFYGIGRNKRIVLYDTLLEQMKGSDEPILAVLCHEIGHWKHGHIFINIGISLAHLFSSCYGAGAVLFNKRFYESFGFHNTDPVIGVSLFLLVFLEPISKVIGHICCYISRKHEFQADRFAVSQGYGEPMKKALLIMTKENKSSITPDPLYSTMTYTHPPMLERLEALDAEIKKQK
ncbi:CAAX prenyl protease 1 putative metallo-peptidase Clan M- Family M48 [Leptomonas seymouri]|uniref:CAAX prenyl protease n=1 Tax=Leptomonas seymouri TaxID=5684 RepID=A0A0N1PC87_LEPSE|nr:CAAX prenyl protease 1 putative metallo-peptidase Clan M- Family M48 [Leptomonas seymouri]|eukprot:KPI85191.1 CAAX prenyl protease 1 putative metallo-peptidase Clan M- Family M48 [Leptomonas seymouri]